ncbi:HD domain-containing protein [Urechidicola sp. KH5]
MAKEKTNKLKILNDPIYGFITIPNSLIFDLIEHPYFQRLRRVSQMGLSYLVYPGAHHTRFQHAIGCMHLMQRAVRVLQFKNIDISKAEEDAVVMAILMHDIGHGAFSHALEHSIVTGISHEEISIKFMEKLNTLFGGKLSLAIEIFKGNYHRPFLNQLISSQLDMDRLDYLKRDGFYTGVSEGNINSDRLITMLNVKDEQLVVEEKGVYSVEKFIVSRRLMYWQVYLHKTGLVAEKLLVKLLKRAKELVQEGKEVKASATLTYFLEHQLTANNFNDATLETFSRLDDYDVLGAIKEWIVNDDSVLSYLAESLVNRKLYQIEIQTEPFESSYLTAQRKKVQDKFNISEDVLEYYFIHDSVSNQAYSEIKNQINILYKDGSVKDVVEASDNLNIRTLAKPVVKHFICYPKTTF